MKTLYIISGANGSGKTTFAKSFANAKRLYFINSDEIFEKIASNSKVLDKEKYEIFCKDIECN